MAALSATLPSSPIVNAVTGYAMPEWRAMFLALMNRTGGNQGVDTAGLEAEIAQERSARAAADLALQNAIAGVGAAATSGASDLRAALTAETNARVFADSQLLPKVGGITGPIGFQGSPAISKPTVTGAKAGNAALADLLTTLATYGLIVDATT